MAFFVKCEGGNLGTGLGGTPECEGGNWVAVPESAMLSWSDQVTLENANEILAAALMLWGMAWATNKVVRFVWGINFGRF